ncbi:Selenocysteine lyase [Heterocephalus glaber]|uniref:Selenocysteine lyase n=1 Tax=Heterocephalus glaber TaxID=10181 RepID=G5BHH1_HETGA|nr:Selenocysteine lyase [Heterocephalus glaber]
MEVAVPARGARGRGRAGSPAGGHREKSPPERKVYMDHNATTPLESEVIQAVTEAMREAWGNPSSPYPAGRKAKDIIAASREALARMLGGKPQDIVFTSGGTEGHPRTALDLGHQRPLGHSVRDAATEGRKAKDIIAASREALARMLGGKPQDIVFTSGGTESNNLVIHSVVKHFQDTQAPKGDVGEQQSPREGARPHIITCTVEHDSIRLPLEHLVEEQVAEVTFVPVSKVSGQAEVEDIMAAVRPATCLVTVMLANNETGVVMPISEISQRVKALNQKRAASGLPRVLLHTDAAQVVGKRRLDVEELGVDFLTIVGHKFYGPRIGALYIRGLGKLTPLYPMLFGGGQERNFRPGTENTPMIAGLGKRWWTRLRESMFRTPERADKGSPDCLHGLETRLEISQRLHRPPCPLCLWHLRVALLSTWPLGPDPGSVLTLSWDTLSQLLTEGHPGPVVPYSKALVRLQPCGPGLFTGLSRSLCPMSCPQAAELVTENCEAYEAHMRDVRDYLEDRLEAEFGRKRIHLNSRFPGAERLPNTCNVSIRGPQLQGYQVLAQCRMLLASVGAACHSDHGDQPSPVLLSCGVPFDVARNALRLSVGRSTTRADVDLAVQDLKQAVARLEGQA